VIFTARISTRSRCTKKAGTITGMGNIKTLKPFQSGPDPRRNTNRRPKGSRNVRTVLMEVLKQKVMVNGEEMTVSEAIVLQVAKKAARGNLRATQIVMDRVDGRVPKTVEIPVPRLQPEKVVLTPEEQADYERYFKRNDHV
jgi:hypothetical protein